MTIQLLVYCNANEREGYGHFFRCLNIVRHVTNVNKEINIVFAGDFTLIAQKALKQYSFSYYNVTLQSLLKGEELNGLPVFKYLLFDTYLVDQAQLDVLCSLYKLIKVDDFNQYQLEKAYGVINFTLNGINQHYTTSNKLLGIEFFPYRLETLKVRNERLSVTSSLWTREKLVIVLFFSATQFNQEPLLQLMKCLDNYFINCDFKFIGKGMEKVSLVNNQMELLEPKIEIEEYYEKADLIICGGGLVKYESAFCGIPNFSAAVTPEQHNESLYFQKQHLTYEIGTLFDFDLAYCESRLDQFFSSDLHFKDMMKGSERCFTINKLSQALSKLLS